MNPGAKQQDRRILWAQGEVMERWFSGYEYVKSYYIELVSSTHAVCPTAP